MSQIFLYSSFMVKTLEKTAIFIKFNLPAYLTINLQIIFHYLRSHIVSKYTVVINSSTKFQKYHLLSDTFMEKKIDG